MEVTPIGIVAVALWFAFAYRGLHWALAYTICLIPFGMASVANLPALGDLSLPLYRVCAALTTVALLFQKAFAVSAAQTNWRLPAGTYVLAGLAAYGVLSAVFLPRLFAGSFYVFPMARGSGEESVGPFLSTVSLIAPSTGNFSQTVYFLASASFFVAAYILMDRPGGARLVHRALAVATFIHGGLAVMDATQIPWLLEPFRTANYTLLEGNRIAGITRIIGGFPEASGFGSVSVVLLAYFVVHFMHSGSRLSGAAAFVAGACAAASLSSTAYLGLFFVALYLVVTAVARVVSGRLGWQKGAEIGLVFYAAAVVVMVLVAFTSFGDRLSGVLDELIFSKSTSRSGVERAAWAEYGYRAFIESYGLGAGLGSIRSNGVLPVFLGSVGIVGTVLYATFLFIVLGRPIRRSGHLPGQPARDAAFAAARAGALAQLVVASASATTPDFGLNLALLLAMTELARRYSGAAEDEPVSGTAPLGPRGYLVR